MTGSGSLRVLGQANDADCAGHREPGENPSRCSKRSAPAHNARVNRTPLLWLVLFGLSLVVPLLVFGIMMSWRAAWTAWWRSMAILAACATVGLAVGLLRVAG
jgi:hypothetical protein